MAKIDDSVKESSRIAWLKGFTDIEQRSCGENKVHSDGSQSPKFRKCTDDPNKRKMQDLWRPICISQNKRSKRMYTLMKWRTKNELRLYSLVVTVAIIP